MFRRCCAVSYTYIDQILQEIEERAPAFTRQRDDFEKSVEMVSNLSRQLDLAAEEADTVNIVLTARPLNLN